MAVAPDSDAYATWAAEYADVATAQEYIANGKAVFVVRSGDLGLSVIVFTICAIICLGWLAIKRKMCARGSNPNPNPNSCPSHTKPPEPWKRRPAPRVSRSPPSRRNGGELGGPFPMRTFTALFFCLLWVIYVLVSSFQTTGKLNVSLSG